MHHTVDDILWVLILLSVLEDTFFKSIIQLQPTFDIFITWMDNGWVQVISYILIVVYCKETVYCDFLKSYLKAGGDLDM